MAKVVVRDLDPRVDGEYDMVGVDDWTYDEWFLVKKISGLVLADFLEAEESGMADTAVIYAIASVSLERAGRTKAYMVLKHGKLDNIDLVPDAEELEAAEEEEASPPASPPTESDDSNEDSTESDGESAKPPSALSVVVPSPTGDQTSRTGSPPSAMSA